MSPETPLLQLVPARARAMLSRIKSKIWSRQTPLEVAWTGPLETPLPFDKAQHLPLHPIKAPMRWGHHGETGVVCGKDAIWLKS